MRNLGLLLVAHLILTSLRTENLLAIKIQNFTASVPVSYFLAITSFQVLLASIAFCNLTVAITLKAKESSRIRLSGFSTSVFGLLTQRKNEDVTLGLPIYSNNFLKEIIPTSSLLTFALLTGLAASLLPTLAFSISIFVQQFDLLQNVEIQFLEKAALACGLVILAFSWIYSLLFLIPLPMKKNQSQIRWNFLFPIRLHYVHPQSKNWLSK
jgi:hypothetical protein